MQVDVLGQPSLALHITYYILHLTYLNNASGCSRATQFGITYYILHITYYYFGISWNIVTGCSRGIQSGISEYIWDVDFVHHVFGEERIKLVEEIYYLIGNIFRRQLFLQLIYYFGI